MGLHKVKTDFLGSMLIYFTYFNLLCSLSLLNTKLTFPNINNVCSFEDDLDDLMRKKGYLLALKSCIYRAKTSVFVKLNIYQDI